jgi:restriction endonuclease S subunit
MNTKVSYGSLAPAMIGGLGVVVSTLLAKAKRGEAPVSLRKLSDVIEFSDSGIWGDNSLDPDIEPRVFRVSDFNGDFRLDYSSAPARAIAIHKLAKFQLRRGDILVVKSSGSANQVVSGRAAVFDSDSEQAFAASNFLLRLRPRVDIDPHFLAFVLGSPPTREAVADSVKTMTYPNLSFRIYSTIEVPVIPLADQRLVGAFFDALLNRQPLPALPAYLAEQRRVVARIEELAAQIQEARTLRRKASAETEFLVPRFIGAIFDNLKCATKPLGEAAEKRTGAAYKASDFSDSDGVPVVRLKEIGSKSPTVFLRNPEDYSNVWLETGDIVLAKTSFSTGAMCQWPGPRAVLNQNAVMLRAKDGLDQRFLFAWLQQQVNRYLSAHLADPNYYPYIREADLVRWQVLLPPLPEQRRIVAKLDALQAEMDALKHLQAETAAELDALLPSILDRAFKGEL